MLSPPMGTLYNPGQDSTLFTPSKTEYKISYLESVAESFWETSYLESVAESFWETTLTHTIYSSLHLQHWLKLYRSYYSHGVRTSKIVRLEFSRIKYDSK